MKWWSGFRRNSRYGLVVLNDFVAGCSIRLSFVLRQELTLTDDTVLEEHYEDPRLLQIKLLGEGGTPSSFTEFLTFIGFY